MAPDSIMASGGSAAPDALELWCGRNPGWAVRSGMLSRTYHFPEVEEAARFGSVCVRRAARLGAPVAAILHGPALTLQIVAPQGGFTAAILTRVGWFDRPVRPPGPSSRNRVPVRRRRPAA